MTDDPERDPAATPRPAPPYVRRSGEPWRDELPSITRYLYDTASEPREPVLQSIHWTTAHTPAQPPDDVPRPVAPPAQAPTFVPAAPPQPQRSAPASGPSAASGSQGVGRREQTGAWILEEWEQYDWKKAASLTADPELAAAEEAWGDLDWEPDEQNSARQRPPQIVADILEGIARRIRSGDIRVSGSEGMTEEAALTTVLAALLGVKR